MPRSAHPVSFAAQGVMALAGIFGQQAQIRRDEGSFLAADVGRVGLARAWHPCNLPRINIKSITGSSLSEEPCCHVGCSKLLCEHVLAGAACVGVAAKRSHDTLLRRALATCMMAASSVASPPSHLILSDRQSPCSRLL